MTTVLCTFSNEDCVRHKDLISKYFKIRDFGFIDEMGNCIIDFNRNYFYKSSAEHFYPIPNLVMWHGDFYDSVGNIVLTKERRNDIVKNIEYNQELIKFNGDTNIFLIDRIYEIAASYANDYYASIRSFNKNDEYQLTKALFNDVFSSRFAQAGEDVQSDIITDIGLIIDKIAPGLISLITEYGSVYNLSYTLLNVCVSTSGIVVNTSGDWRIMEWERMTATARERERALKEKKRLFDAEQQANKIALKEVDRNSQVSEFFRENIRRIRTNADTHLVAMPVKTIIGAPSLPPRNKRKDDDD